MKNVLLFAAFISFNSFGQDKYTGMNGYLKVTQDNIYLMTWQNNAYTHITDMASLSFTDKAEAIEFVNDYKDCVENVKSITKSRYSIVSTKKAITLSNSDGQYQTAMKKYLKKGLVAMEEALNYME